ncbi:MULTISPECIES: ribonuclease Y [unclassified Nitratiruptor]|uniref:ribonuclease Y n=1 Tax=unclassified Nitratiruptor TaxID=2624044 RepID=UPI001914DEF0|nr:MULTISPECIES: ribonuclease Y [unclassified Nitratiruptor]
MWVEILVGSSAAIISGAAGYLLSKKIEKDKLKIYEEQARAKAKAIEHEAEKILQNAQVQVKEAELELKKDFEKKLEELKRDYDERFSELMEKEMSLKQMFKDELKHITLEKQEIKAEREEVNRLKNEYEELKKRYEEKYQEVLEALQQQAGLTLEEAKNLILQKAEEESRLEIANIVRKYEEEAKREAKRRANYIIAQATTRFAGEFAAERLINTVSIPSEDIKGRIIGKEGRNIKTLEMLLGVDIIIDDTPNAIILSSFNLYRRAIATKVIELLVEDGRIQPSRIEEIYEKVKEEFDQQLLEEGENIVIDLGIGPIHPEIVKLIGRLKFRASYGQNALGHSLEVAHLAGIMAAEMGGDEVMAKRAGLLHDIGKALTHEYSGSHVDLGAEICKRYKEPDVVINAIYAHHGHEEPRSIEAAAVCAADTLSAARPGARREVLEAFLKRVQAIEEIALSKPGVKKAYAINAGREVRVIVNAELVNDNEAVLLAKEIAKDIESGVQYPGEIKVNVIRENRAIEYAR